MKKNIAFVSRLHRFIASERFFWMIVAVLVLQSLWIALSSRYPMAFDEDFHLGIIRLYAHHISPFWSGQPPGANAYGAVARDPSYLYQYLMSFPYRLLSAFTHDQTVQVLWLRAINIALFTSCLPLYRRLLLKVGASRAVVHSCLVAFVLLPIVPLLAAQINYDNLLMPTVALALLLAVKVMADVKRRELKLEHLIVLLIVCALGSLVKYAFLPIVVAVLGCLVFMGWHRFGGVGVFTKAFSKAYRAASKPMLLGLTALLLVSIGLVGERYGVNLVRYHNPVPDCGQVLSVKQCSAYGPWIRDYNYKINKVDADAEKSPLTFTIDWFYGMWLRTFFAVGGPATNFQTRGPLPVTAVGSVVIGVAAVGSMAIAGRRLFRRYNPDILWLLGVTIAAYTITLWLDEYRAWLRTGQPVAINGRYLLPVLLPLFVIAALAVSELLGNRLKLKLALAGLTTLSLLWGGGALTYILRSNDSWYWPSQPVYDANHAVQKVLGPITPGYRRPTQFLSTKRG